MLLRWPFCLFLFKFMYKNFSGFKMFKKNLIQKIETDSRTYTVFSGERCDTCIFLWRHHVLENQTLFLWQKKAYPKGLIN